MLQLQNLIELACTGPAAAKTLDGEREPLAWDYTSEIPGFISLARELMLARLQYLFSLLWAAIQDCKSWKISGNYKWWAINFQSTLIKK